MTAPGTTTKLLTPDALVNQLFDGALAQHQNNTGQAAAAVIDFMMNALLYALNATKADPVVFLTEAVAKLAGAVSPDDAKRKEMLMYISTMFANAAKQAPVASPPAGAAPTTL